MALRKATAVTSAPPDAEAARVKKMMASRPTLNPNQRRAPRQDLSGAVNGVLTGRGGNPQALGAAAMRRLSAQQPPPPAPPDAAGAAPAAPPPEFADKVGRMAQPMEMPAMRQPKLVPAGGQSPMDAALAGGNITLGKLMGQEMPGGAPPGFEGLTPEQQMAASINVRPEAPGGAAPPGMATGLEGALAGGGAPGMPPGIPPAIMQRLNALRGAQPQGAPGRAPQMRGSFADFWARNSGGQGMPTPY